MSDKALKLSEMLEIDKKVHEKKINVWKAYFLASTIGFTGYHWFFLEKSGLGLARLAQTIITLGISIALLITSSFSLNFNSIAIIVSLVLMSFIWTVVDLFIISLINDKIIDTKKDEIIEKDSHE